MTIVLLILGLALIVFGAHWLVSGSSVIAQRSGMSEFLIGLTIVGMGTSMPEFTVSMFGTIAGNGGVAIGNIVGSNVANILLILGVAALIRPMSISKSAAKIDMPYNILVMVALLFMCFGFGLHSSGTITRLDGAILLVMFAGFMFYSFRVGTKTPDKVEESEARKHPLWLAIVLVIIGLAALIGGGKIFVSSATDFARSIGVSESIIAITIMAVGTSLPELATSIVAAIRGNTQLALGNIIGSNIFNVALILGVCSQVQPLQTTGITRLDVIMPIIASIMLWLSIFTFKKNKLDRWEGAIFLVVYFGYIIYITKPW